MEVKRRTVRALVQRLSSAATAAEAAAEIRRLTKHDAQARPLLADEGAAPLLAHLLDCPDSQDNASAALLNLSISSPETLMSTPGLLDALAAAVRPSSAPAAVAQHAAATLYSLLSVEAYRPIIGSKRPLVAALVALVRSPGAPARSVKDGLKALFGVALYPLNRPAMVELGAVPALFSLVAKDPRRGVVEDATAVVAQVAGCVESVNAFRRVAGVRALVDLVDCAAGAGERVRENAASALLNLALCCGERAVGDIREVEHAEAVVGELAENGTARAKTKASSLLAILTASRRGHDFHGYHSFSVGDFDSQTSLPPPSSSASSTDDTFSAASTSTFVKL